MFNCKNYKNWDKQIWKAILIEALFSFSFQVYVRAYKNLLYTQTTSWYTNLQYKYSPTQLYILLTSQL